jgi:hypothetical protein
MLEAAHTVLTGPVTLTGLVKEKDGGVRHDVDSCISKLDMMEFSSKQTFDSKSTKQHDTLAHDDSDDELPPPLI